MNRDELFTRFAKGERDFSRLDLSGINLFGANLSWIVLDEANLTGADLREANLTGVSLCDANLTGANLYRANLSLAVLQRANLSEANLSKANLTEADLDGAVVVNCLLYSVHAPFMNVRGNALCAGAFEQDGELTLLFTGDFEGRLTADELRALVRDTHGDNAYAAQYLAAIAFSEACYTADLAAGRFDKREAQS